MPRIVHQGTVVAADVVRVNPGTALPDVQAALEGIEGVVAAGLLTPADIEARLGLGEVAADAIGEALAHHRYVEVQGCDSFAGVAQVIEQIGEPLGGAAVFAVAFEGHWGLEPGGENATGLPNVPSALVGALRLLEAPYIPDPTRPRVGIVDSGFPADGYPGLAVGLTLEDAADVWPSHGSFVASIIRLLAPNANVRGALSGVVGKTFVTEDGETYTKVADAGNDRMVFRGARNGSTIKLSDEAAVDIAIRRISSGAGTETKILNLSLGTFAGRPGSSIPPPSIVEATLESLDTEGWTIVAAGGNDHDDPGQGHHHGDEWFYPAAFDEVIGVAALDAGGQAILWDENGGRVSKAQADVAPIRSVNTFALGVDVIGAGENEPVRWSGSSFATAVASGLIAAANLPTAPRAELIQLIANAGACPPGLWHTDANGGPTSC